MGVKKTVLIVEDEESIQCVLKDIIISEGHNPVVAGDGKIALELVVREKPDLVLLDVMLPKMDGWEVCRKIKEDERTKNIPVLFLTARDQFQDMLQAVTLEAEGYITKPFKVADLKEKIRKMLGAD